MRVLIVEDDASARRGLTELVRAWGHEAEGAADGQEGLEKITTYRPSAVLADMVMPRMDGLELLRRVKEQLGRPHVRADYRPGQRRHRRVGDEGRRVRLPDKAGRSAAAPHAPVARFRAQERAARRREPPPAAPGPRPLRRDGRQRARLTLCLSRDRAGRADGRVGAGVWRVRHRQRARREDDPSAERAKQAPVHRDQLRRHPRIAARERNLRPRARRIHRRDGSAPGLLRAGAYGHAVPRRDRRGLARDSGEAAPGAAGTHDPASRRTEGTVRRRAADCRHQRRPGEGRAARQAARGPVLPHQRHRHLRPAPARARRGHPAPRRDIHLGIQRAQRQGGQGARARGHARAAAILVARQHPRASQRHRARRHPQPGRVRRGRVLAGRPVGRAAAVDSARSASRPA